MSYLLKMLDVDDIEVPAGGWCGHNIQDMICSVCKGRRECVLGHWRDQREIESDNQHGGQETQATQKANNINTCIETQV